MHPRRAVHGVPAVPGRDGGRPHDLRGTSPGPAAQDHHAGVVAGQALFRCGPANAAWGLPWTDRVLTQGGVQAGGRGTVLARPDDNGELKTYRDSKGNMRPPRSKTFEQALGTTDAMLVDLLSRFVAAAQPEPGPQRAMLMGRRWPARAPCLRLRWPSGPSSGSPPSGSPRASCSATRGCSR